MGSQRLAFPLRFACEGEAVQTTSRELSGSSVYVRCVEPPPLGTRVELTLYLPVGKPAAVAGVVAERHEVGSESGFRADFVEPGEGAREAIAATLRGEWNAEGEGRPAPDIDGAWRRALRRYADRLPVQLVGAGPTRNELAVNLNASGAFVQLSEPFALGTRVSLFLALPDGEPPAQVEGEVVRRVTAAEAERRNTAPGAAFLFIAASDEFRARYDAHLQKLATRG